MEEKKNNKGLVWLIVILIILVLGLVGYIIYDKVLIDDKTISNKDVTTTNTTANSEQKIIGEVEFKDNKYILNIDSYKNNKEEVYYKINNNYEVKLIFNFDNNNFRTYDIYVNDEFILTDENFMEPSVNFYLIKGNLVYLNTGFTDVRCEHVYLIEKNNTIHHIYELDTIIGMVPEKITLNEDNILIEGTRFTHGISIVYDKSGMDDAMLEDDTTWSQYGITENTIIKATYKFNFDANNKFVSTPVISNETTIREYLNSNNLN